jgi:hypothetical protein
MPRSFDSDRDPSDLDRQWRSSRDEEKEPCIVVLKRYADRDWEARRERWLLAAGMATAATDGGDS